MTIDQKKIKYQCVRCGNCCKWPGPVRVNNDEINAIAGFINISSADFKRLYTRLIDNRSAISLTEQKNGSCVFLKNNNCYINDVKPKQCIDFPNEWNFSGFEELCNAKRIV